MPQFSWISELVQPMLALQHVKLSGAPSALQPPSPSQQLQGTVWPQQLFPLVPALCLLAEGHHPYVAHCPSSLLPVPSAPPSQENPQRSPNRAQYLEQSCPGSSACLYLLHPRLESLQFHMLQWTCSEMAGTAEAPHPFTFQKSWSWSLMEMYISKATEQL